MNCNSCGSTIAPGGAFCEDCGAPVASPPAPVVAPPPLRRVSPMARSAALAVAEAPAHVATAPPMARTAPPRPRPRPRAVSRPPVSDVYHDAATRRRVRNYFRSFPIWAVALVLFGLLGLVEASRVREPGAFAFESLLILLSGVGAIAYWMNRATDEEIDELTQAACERLQARAYEKVALDADAPGTGEPLVLRAPRFLDMLAGRAYLVRQGGHAYRVRFQWRKGKDDIIRYNPIGIDVLLLSPNALIVYSCGLDLITGIWAGETTDELFYRDIVSMSTGDAGAGARRRTRGPLRTVRGSVVRAIGAFIPMVKPLFSALLARFSTAEVFTVTTKGGTALEASSWRRRGSQRT